MHADRELKNTITSEYEAAQQQDLIRRAAAEQEEARKRIEK